MNTRLPSFLNRRAAGLLLAVGVGFGFGAAVAQPAAKAPGATPPAATAKATFAGGCFWCVEADFDKVPGVISTTSGYIGGTVAHPSYEQVAGKVTGHAEAVEIVYDPGKLSYAQLLSHYWRTIDPTVKDRQFCDVGSPYRTAIFVHDQAQRQAAEASRAALEKTKPFQAPIVTEVVPAGPFYRAEEYHQDYAIKNPLRYRYYRTSCGRDARLKQLWGEQAGGIERAGDRPWDGPMPVSECTLRPHRGIAKSITQSACSLGRKSHIMGSESLTGTRHGQASLRTCSALRCGFGGRAWRRLEQRRLPPQPQDGGLSLPSLICLGPCRCELIPPRKYGFWHLD